MSETKTATMTEGTELNAQQPPAPDPALKKLDRYVGIWDMTGRTIGSDTDNVKGRTTFEWLPGSRAAPTAWDVLVEINGRGGILRSPKPSTARIRTCTNEG